MNNRQGERKKIILIAAMVATVTIIHYSTTVRVHYPHEIYQRLYYVPIILAAFWFGLRGGVLVAISVTFLYIPHIIFQWGGWKLGNLEKFLEIVLYNVIGPVTGYLSDRQIRERKRYQEIAEKLDESYSLLKEQTRILLETEEQLKQADRLSILGKLSASLAHEVRNPLSSIKGVAEILSDKFNSQDEGYDFTQVLIKETDRLNKVLIEFLEFARPKSAKEVASDINKAIQSVFTLTRTELERHNINATLKLDKKFPPVNYTMEELRQVFLNLILNSIQAMPEGGNLTVLSSIIDKKRDAHILDGNFIEISFSDTGHGIPEGDLDKIFAPFFSTKERGTGLGLSIVKRIVENRRGKVVARNNEKRGATFMLSLPLAEGDENVS